MAITRSLGIGTSSLRAHQQKFDVISNNLANLNTIGYKSNRANFQEQFNQIRSYGMSPNAQGEGTRGGTNPVQFGLGVKMGSISKDMSQGATETTNRPLDMAIQGEGFFIYEQNGQQLFSRAGAVAMDENGNLVDSSSGAFLQGYNVETDANGNIIKDANGVNALTSTRDNLSIDENVISSPAQTENVSLMGNLKSSNEEGFEKKTSIKIYDNVGGTHDLQLSFTKTANPNEYTVAASVDGNDVALNETTVLFNNDGSLQSPQSGSISAADLNAALGTTSFDETTPQDLTVNFNDPNNPTMGLKSYATNNSVTISSQDGHGPGSLNGLEVDDKGQVWGAFSNGQSEVLGQVLVAKFTNSEGLENSGGNFYKVSPNSGDPNIGTAVDIFPSTKIRGYALEQSNVDMTRQFTDMISTQRAYEASARTITVSDKILGETTILKR